MRAVLLAACVVLSSPESDTVTAAIGTPSPADGTLLSRAESLLVARNGDSALVLVEPAIHRARTVGNASSLAALLVMQGRILTWLDRPGRAEPGLREALRLADAAGDSTLACEALRWLAAAVGTQGNTAESARLSSRLLTLARTLGDRADEGQALMMIAFHDLVSGRPARARVGYVESVAIFRETHASFWELWALNGLGRVYGALGDFDAERDCYLDIVERSRSLANPFTESVALNNLGVLEFELGDPDAAVTFWQRARQIELGSGAGGRPTVVHNLALALMSLGRFDDASAMIDSALARTARDGLVAAHHALLEMLGEVRNEEQRYAEAAALFRHVLGGPAADVELKERVESAIGLSTALAGMDSASTAREVLAETIRTLGGRAEPEVRLDLELAMARVDLDAHPATAAHLLATIEQEAARLRLIPRRLEAMTLLARAQRRHGSAATALASYERASVLWESRRDVPRDPVWREQYGATSREIFTGLAELMIPRSAPDAWSAEDEARVRDAFDRLQRFKSRTLLERMRGPRPRGEDAIGLDSIATLATLQSGVLEDGELFIDTFVGSDASFVFAVAPNVFRAIRLPGGNELQRRLHLYRTLLTSAADRVPSRDESIMLARTGEAIGRWLLGPLTDLIATHRLVIVAPDGPFNLVPPTRLLPATTDPATDADRAVTVVPSASVLMHLRGASRSRATTAPRTLALFGSARPDGAELSGTLRETRWLARRFRDVTRRGTVDFDLADADNGYDVIHVAAHTVVYDQRPWHSGIYLGEGREAKRYVRAADIARLRLPARLVVLAGCESAGGRTVSGEGVLGLTGAFLSAGVPCVVAALWPVDDRATTLLMQGFYEGLANGDDAAGALRAAKLRLRRTARWHHPFYWSGFLLIGDGSSRVALRRNAGIPWTLAIPLALVLAGAAGLVAVARRRRPALRGAAKSS